MSLNDLSPVKGLYYLWKPVYPYLLRQIRDLYGRSDGAILEVGPFCGTIFALQEAGIGDSLSIATFPEGMGDFFREEAERLNISDAISVVDSGPSLFNMGDNSTDLIIFRGALFFPSLFEVDFGAVYRVLKEKGIALIGGGFGKFTPHDVIENIAGSSRDLNLQVGKIEVRMDEVQKKIQAGLLPGDTEIVSQGGLWVIMRK